MSNTATEQILLSVRNTKASADSAEREYDRKADQLQMKAGRGIDLFDGGAVSQVADIASTARKICDELYAAYQMLIKVLDEDCRPLLAQQPEYRAVRAVRDLVRKLNEESEIENNFTASLNSHSLGGVASGRYIPSMECKMIESYWETKLASWPGREEYEEREQRLNDRIRQFEEKIETDNQSRIDRYYAECAQWQQACESVKARRDEETDRQIRIVRDNLQKTEKENYEAVCASLRQTVQQNEKIKQEAEAALASLGFFQFAQKKEQKAIIQDAVSKIQQANAQMSAAKAQLDSACAAAEQSAQSKKAQIAARVEKEFPLPKRPKLPRIDGVENQREFFKKAILNGMKRDTRYTPADLIEQIPELADLTPQRVMVYLRELVDNYDVERIEEKRKAFFQLY